MTQPSVEPIPQTKARFESGEEVIALGLQGKDSKDIVVIFRGFLNQLTKDWGYECEIIANYYIPIQLQSFLPHPPGSIVYVSEENLITKTEEDF
jgi:hypothetical protein